MLQQKTRKRQENGKKQIAENLENKISKIIKLDKHDHFQVRVILEPSKFQRFQNIITMQITALGDMLTIVRLLPDK